MKIVKTKTIEAKDVSEVSDILPNFKNRAELHNGSIPDFFVYINDLAWNAFVRHGKNVYETLRHEAQGIFVGHYYKDQFGEFVVAIAYEEGYGSSQSAYVEMSEECLAKISEKCQADDTLMLIWVHTHPGFGVFYSGTDYSCLKTNFYKPYQIGIVVDILGKKHKGFKTKGNDVVEYSDYALFNDETNLLLLPYENHKIEIVKKSNGRIDELTDEIKRLKKELQSKISEVEQCEEKLQLKEKDIEHLKSDLQNKTTDISQLQDTLQGKISEIEQIKEELQSKETNIECLNSDLQAKAIDINQLQETLQNKTSEIEQLKEKLQSKISEINQLKPIKIKKFSLFFWRKEE
jgi:predicted  nucleic acid-binding Zn-ribbon protein/proteasome lid subunit RPN8/RPN11